MRVGIFGGDRLFGLARKISAFVRSVFASEELPERPRPLAEGHGFLARIFKSETLPETVAPRESTPGILRMVLAPQKLEDLPPLEKKPRKNRVFSPESLPTSPTSIRGSRSLLEWVFSGETLPELPRPAGKSEPMSPAVTPQKPDRG